MRIHHLNCISACPLGGFLMDGMSLPAIRGRLTSHCLLVESDDGLVLVDTGYGRNDVLDPASRLSKFFLALNKPEFRLEMTAHHQIKALGLDPRDVRHIVLSHLDFDHAGGLDDFPGATVHMLADEIVSAAEQKTMLDRMRYRPQQWGTRALWKGYRPTSGERWFGFERVQRIDDIRGPEVMLVPLPGHTLGHAGVAIRAAGKWLFYAGDAYFYHAEMNVHRPRCTPGLRMYQTLMEKDRRLRLENQRRLRGLVRDHAGDVTLFCAHDVREFERLSGRSHRRPVGSVRAAAAPPIVHVPVDSLH